MPTINLTDPVNGTLADATLIANNNAILEALLNGGLDRGNFGSINVTGADIVDGSVGTNDLADGSVTSAKIADGTITSADIADGTITGADIADGSIGTADLADGAVTASKIAPGAIGSAQMLGAAGSVFWDGTARTGGGFIVMKPNPGIYLVILDSALPTNAHVLVTPIYLDVPGPVNVRGYYAMVEAGTPANQQFRVHTYLAASKDVDSTHADCGFYFQARAYS